MRHDSVPFPCILSVLLLLVLPSPAISQAGSADQRARTLYREAYQAYEGGRHAAAQQQLAEVERLLGSRNAMTESLRARLLFASGDFRGADAALRRFSSLPSASALQGQMRSLRTQVRQRIAEAERREREEREREDRAYRLATQEDGPVAAREYLRTYPQGRYVSQVQARLSEMERGSAREALQSEETSILYQHVRWFPESEHTPLLRSRLEQFNRIDSRISKLQSRIDHQHRVRFVRYAGYAVSAATMLLGYALFTTQEPRAGIVIGGIGAGTAAFYYYMGSWAPKRYRAEMADLRRERERIVP